MRKLVSIIFIFILLYMPIAKVGLTSWYFANIEEITKTLCINKDKIPTCKGSCHLKSQIRKLELGQNEKNQSNNSQKLKLKKIDFFNVIKTSCNNIFTEKKSTKYAHKNIFYSFSPTSIIWSPPKFT